MIVLRFSGGSNLASRAIQAFTWSWASHVDIELADGRLLGAVPGLGVSLRDPDGSAGSLGGERRVERYEVYLPITACHNVESFARRQLGRPYDWAAIAGMVFRKDWRDDGKWFCSELVAAAFEASGHRLLQADHLDRITPRDLLMSTFLKPLPA